MFVNKKSDKGIWKILPLVLQGLPCPPAKFSQLKLYCYGGAIAFSNLQKAEDRRQRAFMLPRFLNVGLKKDVLIQETIVVYEPKLFSFRRGL